jgi:hypothetical protein
MVRETIGGSAFRVKNPASAKKNKEMDAIDESFMSLPRNSRRFYDR